ncbi:chemotaxis protein CheC [Alkalihalobacterium alkalinitrilicum]|uniref:chemotaxis protein CheC n=1 Tax=Alkalihalobacterium alkalinitrilicum TaxID=427920 RepID=UPI000994FEE4|nr:chemotaxis protein CheC [Alkalihalobacterium alkalinitrilicum]
MSYYERIKPYHLDVLKEIGNIGAGNAATALSKLLNKSIDMKVPSVKIISFQEITELVGGADQVVAAIFLRLEGEAPGSMFLLLPIFEAEQLIQRLTGNSKFQLAEPPFDEIGLSALQEMGNILAGSYLSALSDFTRLNLQPSVPAISIDLAGAILSYGLIEVSQVSDYVIVINTEVHEVNDEFQHSSGHFFLLPDPNAFGRIFNALGVEMDE